MGNTIRRLAVLALAVSGAAFAVPASAKSDPKAAKPAAHLRWAHTYAAAMAEAKDRGCVVFATFHEDG